jgi:hypothetical protein
MRMQIGAIRSMSHSIPSISISALVQEVSLMPTRIGSGPWDRHSRRNAYNQVLLFYYCSSVFMDSTLCCPCRPSKSFSSHGALRHHQKTCTVSQNQDDERLAAAKGGPAASSNSPSLSRSRKRVRNSAFGGQTEVSSWSLISFDKDELKLLNQVPGFLDIEYRPHSSIEVCIILLLCVQT